ncbi:MAG: rhodanese-like domain-containing protein [Thermomicrobiales bacterium]
MANRSKRDRDDRCSGCRFRSDRPFSLDARISGEYAAGHIPGAVNIPFLDNAVDGTAKYWKSPDDLRMMYQAAGVTTNK